MSVYVPPESLLESKAFRRLLAFSLVGHVVLFGVLTFRPRGRAELISPSPVMVNVVQAPPAPTPAPAKAAPKPPPKPEVKPPPPPPPPPPKPVVNEVVIPKEPAPLPAKPKPAPKPVEKPAPTKTAEQLLAELTEKVEAEHPEPPPVPSAPVAPAAPMAGGPGVYDPLMSPWIARVRSVVHANWSGAQLCKGKPKFDVDVDSGGAVVQLLLVESSGDRYCDESAERAIRKSNPLPPSPRGAISIELTLNPTGVL